MSRELDAEVAEKVMGWKKDTERIEDYYNEIYITHYDKDAKGRDCAIRVDLPHFSTGVAAAFQVVEKMREKGFAHTVTSNCDGKHISLFLLKNKSKYTQSDLCESAPLAICKAALLAIHPSKADTEPRP